MLGGGRGKGVWTEHSDWDCYVIAADGKGPQAAASVEGLGLIKVDAGVQELNEFMAYAAVGSEFDWDRYAFAHVRASLDKLGGQVQLAVDAKGTLPPEASERIAREALDAYCNSMLRSLKNARDGERFAARLDAQESLPFLLETLFAWEGRVRPFNKFLRWELEHFPLAGSAMEDLLEALGELAGDGDPGTQAALFRTVEGIARTRGCGDVLDAWGADLELLRAGA